MEPDKEFAVETALSRGKEIAADMLPSWEGGFACVVIEAIEALQSEVSRLQRTADNLQAEVDGDDSFTFCECGSEHSVLEVTRPCKTCGGIVAGIVMLADG